MHPARNAVAGTMQLFFGDSPANGLETLRIIVTGAQPIPAWINEPQEETQKPLSA
jgi:hypothetical protein